MPEDDRKYLFTFTVDDKPVDVDLFDVTGIEWRAMKRASGYGRLELTRGVEEGEFDCIAAFVWMLQCRDADPDDTPVYTDLLAGMTLRGLAPPKPAETPAEDEPNPPD